MQYNDVDNYYDMMIMCNSQQNKVTDFELMDNV